MNNCYSGIGTSEQLAFHWEMDERDRSLPVVEVSLSVFGHGASKAITGEGFPDTSAKSESKSNGSVDQPVHSVFKPDETDIGNALGMREPAPAAASRNGGSKVGRAPIRKFLSRSHGSLLAAFPQTPVDYSKVESKVKKYIDAMKEHEQQRRAEKKQQRWLSDTTNHSVDEGTGTPSNISTPSEAENVTELKSRFVQQEMIIAVLQENHDSLLLQKARLQNQIEELKGKLRLQQLRNENRTNSSLHSSGNPAAEGTSTQLGHSRNLHSIPLAPCLQLPVPVQPRHLCSFDDVFGNDEDDAVGMTPSSGSSIDSELIDVTNAISPSLKPLQQVEIRPFGTSGFKDKLTTVSQQQDVLWRRLGEITVAALTARDQSRTLIRRMGHPNF